MTTAIDTPSNQTQTNWPVIVRAKTFILDEKNTTFKIIKLLSSIIIFPLALVLDLTYKTAKFCWGRFSLYVKASLAKKKEPGKKSLTQKIKSLWTNHKRKILLTASGSIALPALVFLYHNRPLVPHANLAKEYEDKLVKIAKVYEARKTCIRDIQEIFIPERTKMLDLYKEVDKNQRASPLVDENNPFKKFTSFEDLEQADEELSNKRNWAIDECNKKFFQEIDAPLWSIKNKETYFQNRFF